MLNNRRSFLHGLASLPLTEGSARAVAPNRDHEILAIEASINALAAEMDEIMRTRIEPYENEFHEILSINGSSVDSKKRYEAAWTYSRWIGRDAAVEEHGALAENFCTLIGQLMRIPAYGSAGKTAKVRVLVSHVAQDMRGPSEDLDWDVSLTRGLLAELAGMGEAEMAAI